MHPTKNDLPQKTRAKVIAVLSDRLADATDLMLQAKQAHWNVKGPNFIALHELFDKVVESAEEWVDLIGRTDHPARRPGRGHGPGHGGAHDADPVSALDRQRHATTSRRSRRLWRRTARRSAARSRRPTSWATRTPPTSSPRSRGTSTSTSGSSRRTTSARISQREEAAAARLDFCLAATSDRGGPRRLGAPRSSRLRPHRGAHAGRGPARSPGARPRAAGHRAGRGGASRGLPLRRRLPDLRGRHERPARRAGSGRAAADVRDQPRARAGVHGGRPQRGLPLPRRRRGRAGGWRTESGARGIRRSRRRRVGQRGDAVRERSAHRAAAGAEPARSW